MRLWKSKKHLHLQWYIAICNIHAFFFRLVGMSLAVG
jgi:hypothetical protein